MPTEAASWQSGIRKRLNVENNESPYLVHMWWEVMFVGGRNTVAQLKFSRDKFMTRFVEKSDIPGYRDAGGKKLSLVFAKAQLFPKTISYGQLINAPLVPGTFLVIDSALFEGPRIKQSGVYLDLI